MEEIKTIVVNRSAYADNDKEAEVVPVAQIFDYEVLIKYIAEVLKGHLSEKYSSTEGRINIIF